MAEDAPIGPDGNEPGTRITVVQVSRSVATHLYQYGPQIAIVSQLVREVLADIPDADFIEVRAIKYRPEEGTSERTISEPPAGQ